MISRLYNFWQILKVHFWFVPALFCLLFLCATFLLYYLERHFFSHIDLPNVFFKGATEDARPVITALLSAMITMVSLAISITVVVLSTAASQMGPRLIKSFMGDSKTKIFIGLFFGTVMACFVLTIILHARETDTFTPQIVINFVLVLCLINLFVLLGFVHHVAQSCMADNIILKVAETLNDAIDRLTDIQRERDASTQRSESWPKDFDQASAHVFFDRSGYVQNIDYDQLLACARANACYIDIRFKAGHFLIKGEDGLRVYRKTALPDDFMATVKSCFIIGRSRTPTQDIEYSIRHLTEIAIRALSPGINDVYTAIHALDHLSACLARLFAHELPRSNFYDEEGVLRVRAKRSGEADIIFSAFENIRFHGRGMPAIIDHLKEKIRALVRLDKPEEAQTALKTLLQALKQDCETIDHQFVEKKRLMSELDQLLKTLA